MNEMSRSRVAYLAFVWFPMDKDAKGNSHTLGFVAANRGDVRGTNGVYVDLKTAGRRWLDLGGLMWRAT